MAKEDEEKVIKITEDDDKNGNEEKNNFLKYYEEDEDSNKNLLVIISAIIAALFFALGLFSIINYFSENERGTERTKKLDFRDDILRLEKNKFGDTIFSKHRNILVLGVDSNGVDADPFENTRSDTILLFSINPQNKSVNILSIPRDSKVYISEDKGINKINAAHALGGIKLTKRTIEETFGIKIHNYVIFNTEGVVKLIDAIGGVPVYVEKDMHYRDWTGKLHINLTKGEHVLSGKDAECFLRFRMDAMGDIGRTARQQWFLRALAERLKSPEVLPKIPEALKIADKYVKTDLSLYQMSQYAAMATNLDMSKIETATLPGAPNKRGYISYWILDPEKCKEVINRMIYNKKANIDEEKIPVATILYTNDKYDTANSIKEELEKDGYKVIFSERKSLPHSQIVGHSQIITSDFVNKIKDKFKDLENYHFVYDPLNMYSGNCDFTIIISQ